MSTNGPVLGADFKVSIYVENKRVARDFTNVKSCSAKDEYYSGTDEHLDKEDVARWQRYKETKGAIEFEPDNLGYMWAVRKAIQVVERAGQKPNVKLVLQVRNGDGSTSEDSFKDVNLDFGSDAKDRGNRVTVSCDWVGTRIFS